MGIFYELDWLDNIIIITNVVLFICLFVFCYSEKIPNLRRNTLKDVGVGRAHLPFFFIFEIYCSFMYETPTNEIKFGVTDLVAPLKTPEKKRNVLNFPIFENFWYHYYLIYTSFRRKRWRKSWWGTFPFLSLRFQRFWRYGEQHHIPRHVPLGAFFYLSILQKIASGA